MIYSLWFFGIKGMGNSAKRRIFESFGSARAVYEASETELRKYGISEKKMEIIRGNRDLDKAGDVWTMCRKLGISFTTVENREYPDILRPIEEMPFLLFYKGRLRLNDYAHTAAVIGARRCSEEGKNTAIRIASHMAQKDVPIISGMACGIDSYAHTAVLKSGGYTVAVLGHGLDKCYPKEHVRLMKAIEESGTLISEYIPGTPARKYHFPQRNRIIAALAAEIYVVEAGRNSGTRSTIEAGEKFGRSIIVLP